MTVVGRSYGVPYSIMGNTFSGKSSGLMSFVGSDAWIIRQNKMNYERNANGCEDFLRSQSCIPKYFS